MSVLITSALAHQLREIPRTPRRRFVGIYFLIRRDVIVYVGQSTDIEMRVAAQWANTRTKNPRRRMKFDRAAWLDIAEPDLDAYETAFIRSLTPRYNVGVPRASRVADVIAEFCLPAPDPVRLASFIRRRDRAYAIPGRRRAAVARVKRATARAQAS